MKIFTADFETTTEERDCRVWLFGLYDVFGEKFYHGKTIDEFFNIVFSIYKNGDKIFFHNLKFDGEFIINFLFENGFKHSTERKLIHKEFNTLITDMMIFYGITVCYKGKIIKIYDSLKIIPLKISQISKAFGIPEMKGSIDFEKERYIGYQPTKKEIEYVKNDCIIIGKALKFFYEQDLKKITIASNALHDLKKTIGKKTFERLFPKVDGLDAEIRPSYKGGFTWLNPKYKGKIIKNGIVLDVNSLYPYVMRNKITPYGTPIFFNGKYEKDDLYCLHISTIKCSFNLKKGYIPTIQLKNNFFFNPLEYAESSKGESVILTLTSVDLELFFRHYEVENLEYICGWKFKGTNKNFKKYIDKWNDIKVKATKEGNFGLRTIAKLCLNSTYGKFAIKETVKNKIPVYYDGNVKYIDGEETTRDILYVAVASFITAYARELTIKAAQKNYDRFIYADTDSLHLLGDEIPSNIDVDETKLGSFKIEYYFQKGKYLRSKCYINEIDNKLKVVVAGLPEKCHSLVNFKNFKAGAMFSGKLQHKRVKGGVILNATDFTIKL